MYLVIPRHQNKIKEEWLFNSVFADLFLREERVVALHFTHMLMKSSWGGIKAFQAGHCFKNTKLVTMLSCNKN